MCNMSEGGFRRLFREYMGKSPSRYILGIKTEAAKKMLENSKNLNLAEPTVTIKSAVDETNLEQIKALAEILSE